MLMKKKYLRNIKRDLTKRRSESMFWMAGSLFISLAILFTLYSRGIIAVMFINGEPVTLREVIYAFKHDDADNALNNLITQKIIDYEVKKRNITLESDATLNELKRLNQEAKLQGKTVSKLLIEREQSYQDFINNVTTTLKIYEMLGRDIEITEKEIDDYLKNNEYYFENTNEEVVREQIKNFMLNEKISRKYDSWIKDARANIDVNYLVNF